MVEIESGPLADDPTTLLHVRCRPSGAARDALTAALHDITGASFLAGPVALHDGYLLMIEAPFSVVRRVPTLLADRLTTAGVHEAVIARAPVLGDRHGVVPTFAPAARAWLVGRAAALLGPVVDWLELHRVPGTDPVVLVISAEFPSTWQNLHGAMSPPLSSGTKALAMSTDFATAASVVAVAPTCASLTAAGTRADGPGPTVASTRAGGSGPIAAGTRADGSGHLRAGRAQAVARAMEGLRDLIRTCAPSLLWAGVGVEPDARHASHATWSPDPSTVDVWDLVVPDAMWYQLISRGHLARLGGPPDGALSIGDGRYELTVGDPADWLTSPAVPRERARTLLAARLPDEPELAALQRERMRVVTGDTARPS